MPKLIRVTTQRDLNSAFLAKYFFKDERRHAFFSDNGLVQTKIKYARSGGLVIQNLHKIQAAL